MADEEMEGDAPAADASHGLATALIFLTTIMLVLATFATLKLLADRYHEGMLK